MTNHWGGPNTRSMPSTVILKALAAASGLGLWTWVLLHLLGNLTVFSGAGATDGYAAALHARPLLLWTARVGLAAAALVHLAAITVLARRARRARPRAAPRRWTASRTMRWGGVFLLLFIAGHVLHLTFGVGLPGFAAADPYRNIVTALHRPLVAAAYLLAVAILGLHLFHGLASSLRSLGWAARGTVLRALAALVTLGFASIPLAVVAGVLR
jgi:succinate dehydrogenase / fumarate reductase cytochrome b subunit